MKKKATSASLEEMISAGPGRSEADVDRFSWVLSMKVLTVCHCG